jgi:hypothetical protein
MRAGLGPEPGRSRVAEPGARRGEESEVEQAGMGPSREVSGSPRGAGPAGPAGPSGPVESERVGP